MLKLVAALALVGALAAGVFVLPLHGRTVADRWNAASGPASFAQNAWDEARRAVDGDRRHDVPAPSTLPGGRTARAKVTKRQDGARAASAGADRPAAPLPVERHTDEDRAAIDRLLSDRSR